MYIGATASSSSHAMFLLLQPIAEVTDRVVSLSRCQLIFCEMEMRHMWQTNGRPRHTRTKCASQ